MRKKRISWEHVAAAAWPVLTRVANEGSTLSYKELGALIGIHHRNVRLVLEVIQQYCIDANLPPLTGLIVRQGQGTPGSGFVAWDVRDLETGLGLVYRMNWLTIPNPFLCFDPDDTIKTLATQIVKDPTRSADIYRKVKDRGIAQQIFREGLLKAYDRRCAMCDLSFCDALEAAHIIPFADCSFDQRINV